jgi:hypothetical protein
MDDVELVSVGFVGWALSGFLFAALVQRGVLSTEDGTAIIDDLLDLVEDKGRGNMPEDVYETVVRRIENLRTMLP